MLTKQSELDVKAAKWGGVFDPSVLVESFGHLLTELVDSASVLIDGLRQHMSPKWTTRPIQVAFTKSEEVNACATKGRDADYILITIGAVGKIYGTLNGLLSIPGFLPEVGNSDREDTPNESLADGFPKMPLLGRDYGGNSIRFYLPADQTRVTFANQLSSMALHFLLMHEIGHILAGHLELLERQGFAAAISEFDAGTTKNATMPPRHVLESDADAFAANFGSFVDLHPETNRLWKEVFGWEAVPGKDAGFIAHAAAISILFRLLTTDSYPPKSLQPSIHPHPTVRSCMVLSRSMSRAVLANRFTMDEFPRLCRASIFHVEETWAALGLPGQRLGASSNWANQIGRLSKRLNREYDDWKATLRKFTRLPPRWH
jgi:hypothetical protein